MASRGETFFLVIYLLAKVFITTISGDADVLTDFVPPTNTSSVDGNFFTFTGMRALFKAQPPSALSILKASLSEFPALKGHSVSYAVLQYYGGSVNPVHIHPRSDELLFLVQGTLQVGFMDMNNKLYTQKLEQGDMFLFPKGLVQFQYNADATNHALAISAFGGANPGTVSIPTSIFTSGIDDDLLALSFKTDVHTIQRIKEILNMLKLLSCLSHGAERAVLNVVVFPRNNTVRI